MEKKQQVIQWLEDHRQDYVELLQKLVRIPSISGNEYDVQMAVKEYAEAHGFTVVAQAFDEAGPIGTATHKRFLVQSQRFLDKTYAKL